MVKWSVVRTPMVRRYMCENGLVNRRGSKNVVVKEWMCRMELSIEWACPIDYSIIGGE